MPSWPQFAHFLPQKTLKDRARIHFSISQLTDCKSILTSYLELNGTEKGTQKVPVSYRGGAAVGEKTWRKERVLEHLRCSGA